MAQGVLFKIAEGMIASLGSMAFQEIKLLWGAKDELNKLMNTVSTIKAVLHAEEQQPGNHAVGEWLVKLNDAIYDADDLLDDLSTEALLREMMTRDNKAKDQVRIFFSKSNQLVYGLKMGHKIKAIRERLDAIAADRKFHLKERHDAEITRVCRNRERDNTHSFVRADKVIGREGDRKAVIERLMESSVEENVSILPIVGMGGLGKTTLAQLLFSDEKIEKHFQLKMWVCVSDTFDVKNIVEKILESATKRKQEIVEMDTLIHYLHKEIDGKKYLLVLDDVWNEDPKEWFRLKEVLIMGGARGSRILVTTRSEKVAMISGTVHQYSLRGLDEVASWSLFKHMAFEKGLEPENSGIMTIGKEIVEKCSGVPLAIRTMGCSLHFKTTESEWLSFKNNQLSKIPQKENDILPTLKLSYDQLPSHLKHCFAYCSLFPKDHTIHKLTLINLWIAQGFIKLSDQNQCLEDVGHEYFVDLLWRSFFQEAEIDEFGNIIQCKMHDLMHDLAKLVAGSLITTLELNNKKNIDEKTRHLSTGYDLNFFSQVPTSLSKASRIRTFLCPSDEFFVGELDCDSIFSSFNFLRVLDLHGRKLDLVPSSVCKLKHLRYLDLSRNDIKKLPDSITGLQNLKTLRLSFCFRLEELPRDINKLVNLRHLEIDECKALTYMPCGLGQLTNLQTLSKFVVYSGSDLSRHSTGELKDLNELNNLRGKLVIGDMRHIEKDVGSKYKAANLKEKEHLHALHLIWSSVEEDVNDSEVVDDEMLLEGFRPHTNLKKLHLEGYRGTRLPSWLLSLTNLVEFRLLNCKNCQYLPPLSQLPSLKCLIFRKLDAMQYISDSGDSNEFSSSSSLVPEEFFPSLNVIDLEACPNLKGWWKRRNSFVEVNGDNDHLQSSFPHLSSLRIWGCPMLTSMPMFPHLEENLIMCNASLKPLQQTMKMNMSSTPLSKLKHLKLISIAELKTLPQEWLLNLTSLESLLIWRCHGLESLSEGIQHLTALQDLQLAFCNGLDLANDEDGTQWQGLKSLLSLRFTDLPKLVSLPSGLQHVTTLQMLRISYCDSLTAIPEWIHNCTSLQLFEIGECSSLSSLPKGMRRLTSSRRLEIRGCPKIAHIPELY